MYCCVPTSAIGANAAADMSEIIVIGPVDICEQEPNSAATITGTNAVYKPTSIGKPANDAYAIDCGIKTRATLIQATKSPLITQGSFNFFHHDKKGKYFSHFDD
jgi:hypothetical protein